MRTTLKNQRKALTALALGFATAAIFATAAAASVGTAPTPGQYSSDLEAEQELIHAPRFSPITSAAELYAGQLEPAAAQSVEIPYLSWGATADDLGPFKQANQSGEGVTPTNLARAYHPIEQGVAQPDGFQPQLQGDQPLIVRDKPDGFQPQTKTVGRLTVSTSSDSFDRGDLALGFGLGLILATACAIALAATRDRQRTRMAHS
jgi:hypothetical protein